MTDLIQEFFNRDLTEPEHEALSKLLEESPEAALRYEGLLEKNYLATGLPQPTVPQGLQTLPPGLGGATGVGWAKLAAVGLVLLGGALWEFWPEPKAESPVPSHPAPALTAPRPAASGEKAPLPVKPSASGPVQAGQELSVLVDLPRKCLVTVHILDENGTEVRNLYTGFREAGRWTFQWDGLLDNGLTAKSGHYRIDVQSGETHQSKDVQIKLQPTSR